MRTTLRIARVFLAMAVLLTGAWATTGCSVFKADPAEAMESSNNAMAELETMSFSADMEVEAEGQTVPITMEGVCKLPSDTKITMTTTAGGETFEVEMIVLGETAYTKYPGSDQWGSIDTGVSQAAPGQTSSPTSYLAYLQSFADVEDLGNEQVGDVECYHWAVDVDEAGLMDVVLEQAETGGVTIEDPATIDMLRGVYENATIDIEVWVGTDDMLVRKEVIAMTTTGDIAMKMRGTILFDDFNEPVTIEAPADAVPLQELLESAGSDAEVQACFANQRVLYGGVQMYLLENDSPPATFDELVPDIIAEVPVCPAGGIYTLDVTTREVSCSVHGQYAD